MKNACIVDVDMIYSFMELFKTMSYNFIMERE